MALIDDYIADLANVERLYNLNWALPYSSAYTTAHTGFKATLQSQADWDKFKLDLFMTAATIGFGAGLGAMFGKAATLGSVAVDQALAAVCSRNMTRTFNLMAAVSASVPGTFIVEQIWTNVGTKIGAAATAQVQAMISAAPASASAIQDPLIMKNDLEAYVLRIVTAAHAVAHDIRDSARMSANEKDLCATAMRTSQFFRAAPTRDLIGARQAAADIMELGFYMVLMMDADFLEETTFWQQGTRDGIRTRRLGSVTTSTHDPTYGAVPATRSSYGLGHASTTQTSIGYERPGSRILDRINTLYQAKFNGDFKPNGWFDTGMGRADVARAEDTIERLNKLVLAKPF